MSAAAPPWLLVLFAAGVAHFGCDWDRFAASTDTTAAGGAGGANTGTATAAMSASSGQGGGSAGGGGASAARCGGMELVLHDFDPNGSSPTEWDGVSGVTLTDPGAELLLSAGAMAGATPTWFTEHYFDMNDAGASVELLKPTDPLGPSYTRFRLSDDANQWVEFRVAGTQILARYQVAGVEADIVGIPFDAAAHRFLRLREEAGTMYWDVSPDRSTWFEFTSMPTAALFRVDFMRVELRMNNEMHMLGDTARFDNLAGEGPAAGSGWCPAASLRDDFDDGEPVTREWLRSSPPGQIPLVEIDGTLHFNLPANDTTAREFRSSRAYDLTGSHFGFELVEAPTSPSEFYLTASADRDKLTLRFIDGDLEASYEVDGNTTVVRTEPYDATTMRWLRIVESGGAVGWQRSPDGKTWNDLGLLSPPPFDVTRVDVRYGARLASPNPSPGRIVIDNFNVLPD
jgi:hypothetical protein